MAKKLYINGKLAVINGKRKGLFNNVEWNNEPNIYKWNKFALGEINLANYMIYNSNDEKEILNAVINYKIKSGNEIRIDLKNKLIIEKDINYNDVLTLLKGF